MDRHDIRDATAEAVAAAHQHDVEIFRVEYARLVASVLATYHVLPAVRADFLRRLHRWPEAAAQYREALRLADNVTERRFLDARLAGCEGAVRA